MDSKSGEGVIRFHYSPDDKNTTAAQGAAPVAVTIPAQAESAATEEQCPSDYKSFASLLTVAATVLFIISVTSSSWVEFQNVWFPSSDSPATTHIIAGAHFGLWRKCLRISESSDPSLRGENRCGFTDKSCTTTIKFLGGMNGWFQWDENQSSSDCDYFNTVRAFSLLVVFFSVGASIFQLRASSREGRKSESKAAQYVGIALAVFAIICGFIALGVMRAFLNSYVVPYDGKRTPALAELGSGLWFNVIAWPMLILAVILFAFPATPKGQKNSTPLLLALVSLLCFVFYIIAVITNELVYYNNINIPGWANPVPTSPPYVQATKTRYWNFEQDKVTRGLWKQCATFTNYTNGAVTITNQYLISDQCSDIDTYCNLSGDVGGAIGSCDELRAIRAFLIMAVISSFVAAIAKVLYFRDRASAAAIKIALIATFAASAWGFITMALTVDYYAVAPGDWGFGFWLVLLAWIFEFTNGLVLVKELPSASGKHVLYVSTKVALAALTFGVTAVATTHWVTLHTLPLFADHWTYAWPVTSVQYPPYNYDANTAQYGLWQLCVGFSCVSISSDSTCAVDSGAQPDFNNCSGFNALRAFVLLTVIAEGAFFHHLHRATMAKDGEGLHAHAAKTGFAATAFGVIATAVASSYYDVSVGDYSLSFWLFLVSWVLVFLVSVHIVHGADDKAFHKPGALFGCARLLTLASLIFYILAVVTPRLTKVDTWHRVDNQAVQPGALGWTGGDTDRTSDELGMFYHCIKQGWDQKCRFIHTNCKAVPDHYTQLPDPLFTAALTDCAEFNGIRTSAVIALILSGLAVVGQRFFAYHTFDAVDKNKDDKARDNVKVFAVVTGYASGLWGMFSFALALDYFQKWPTSQLASSFWLLVVAWTVVSVSTFLFAKSERPEYKCKCGHSGCKACAGQAAAGEGKKAATTSV